MPKNKAASYRYRLIDEALRNTGKRWTFMGLLAHVEQKLYDNYDIENFSRRSLEYDIALMKKNLPEGFSAPIKRGHGEIWYTDTTFSIHNQPLIESDIKNLQAAFTVLKQFKGLPHAGQILQVVEKVKGELKISRKNETEKIIFFEQNNDLVGLNWLQPLFYHTQNENELKINYHPFSEQKPFELTFHPFFIKEFNNRWFVIGFNVNEKVKWVLALDRITDIEATGIKIKAVGISGETYFQHVLGVTIPENKPIETIKLRFSSKRTPYILTKPIHSSQKMIKTETAGTVIIELQLIINKELVARLLSFGIDLEILAPISLREKMKSLLEQSLKRYN